MVTTELQYDILRMIDKGCSPSEIEAQVDYWALTMTEEDAAYCKRIMEKYLNQPEETFYGYQTN